MVALALVLMLGSNGAEARPAGLFVGEEFRYRRSVSFLEWTKGLTIRTFADLVSIPTSAGGWSPGEWALAVALVGPTVAAWVPVEGRSLDARLQDFVHQRRGAYCAIAPPGSTVCEHVRSASFNLLTPLGNFLVGAIEVTTPLALLLSGVVARRDGLVEASTLALEAYFVGHLMHVVFKLLSGREGVLTGDGGGRFFGPTRLHFPDGFPSGHAASLFALIGAYSTYAGVPWFTALLLAAGLGMATWLVLDDYHFASEVFFGATAGFLIGRWIVRNRASREWLEPTSVTPAISAHSASLVATWTF